MCVEGKETEKKKERDELFFSVCYRSAQFDFFHIYIVVTERKLKKKWKEEKSRVQRQHHSFFLLCMCVRLLHPQFFYSVCVRAFGVCKYINASESRQIEKREKRRKKSWGRKRMGNTRTLLCFLDVDNSEGRREKGNGTKEKEQNRKVGQPTNGKNNPRERKEKQSRLEMCIDVEYVQKKMHTNTYSSYL